MAAMGEASLANCCLGGGSGGLVSMGGSTFSANREGFGLSSREAGRLGRLGALGAMLAAAEGRIPRDRGGSCGGSTGSEGGRDGRFDLFDLLNLRSRKEGGAGSAFENRDRPVLGVWRVAIASTLESASPAD